MNKQLHIQQKLQQIEQENQIKILLAVESGSRAWGFPSSDSDYDVRVIFIRPQEHYLTIEPPKETFEYIESEWFDVGGWDICKSLKLLRKSNPVLLEWINSPIVYSQCGNFLMQMRALSHDYFQIACVVHHYKGMTKNALKDLHLHQPLKLKKWFYVLRSLLATLWAVKEGTMPPIELATLVQLLSYDVVDEINELVAFKSIREESNVHQLSPKLIKLTTDLLNQVDMLPAFYSNSAMPVEPLNQLFRALLSEEIC